MTASKDFDYNMMGERSTGVPIADKTMSGEHDAIQDSPWREVSISSH